jgi:hypothetical protein
LVSLDQQVQKLLEWQPTAQDIRDAGQCPDCNAQGLLFYVIPSVERTVRFWRFRSVEIAQDAIGGYFFCADCRLCGSGFVRRTQYYRMEVYRGDEMG